MGTLILIVVIFFVIVVISGLISVRWNDNARIKINSLKKERLFWRLVHGFDNLIFDINAIYSIYIEPRHLVNFLPNPDEKRTVSDKEILDLVKINNNVENIKAINKAIEKRDEIIEEYIVQNQQTFTGKELMDSISIYKNSQILVADQFDKLASLFQRRLLKENLKCNDIWEAVKGLDETVGQKLEWKNENEKIDIDTLYSLKKSNQEINKVMIDFICEKSVDNGTKEKLRNAMEQWEKLRMIRWCISDFVADQIGTNRMQHFFWDFLTNFAS